MAPLASSQSTQLGMMGAVVPLSASPDPVRLQSPDGGEVAAGASVLRSTPRSYETLHQKSHGFGTLLKAAVEFPHVDFLREGKMYAPRLERSLQGRRELALGRTFRVHLLALERKIDAHIPIDHPILCWLVEFVGDLASKYLVGVDRQD